MLTKEQLNGKVPVVVINTKLDGTEFVESDKAKIIKVHQGDCQGVYATCVIDGDKVERWIFASKQKES